jgi:hypothetical protein
MLSILFSGLLALLNVRMLFYVSLCKRPLTSISWVLFKPQFYVLLNIKNRNGIFHSTQLWLQTLPFPAHEPFRPLQFTVKTTLYRYWYRILIPTIMLFSTKALHFLAVYETLTTTQPKLPFVSFLRLEGRGRRDKRIHRVSLRFRTIMIDSAFKYFLDSGNDQSILNACDQDHASFWSLVGLFDRIYDSPHFPNESTGFIQLGKHLLQFN